MADLTKIGSSAVKDPWKGFSDPRTWTDFFFIFRVNTFAVSGDKSKLKAELLKCISEKVILDLCNAKFDILEESYDHTIAHMAKLFSAPKRTTGEAFRLLGSVMCKPGVNGHDWASEIQTLAREAGISDEKTIVCHYLRGLPDSITSALSVFPDFDSRPLGAVIPIVHNALEVFNRQQAATSSTPAINALTRGASTSGHRDSRQDDRRSRERSSSPRPRNGRNASPRSSRTSNRRLGSPAATPAQGDRGPRTKGKCDYCGIKGHLAQYCFKRIRDEDGAESDGLNTALTSKDRNVLAVNASVNGRQLVVFADTCASDSFINFKHIRPSDGKLQHSTLSSSAANGSKMDVVGCLPMSVTVGDCTRTILMHVSCTFMHPALLGLSDMSKFGMQLNTRMRTITLDSGTMVTASAVSRDPSPRLSFSPKAAVARFGPNDPPSHLLHPGASVRKDGVKTTAVLAQSPVPRVSPPLTGPRTADVHRVPSILVADEKDLGDPSMNPVPLLASSVEEALAQLDLATDVSLVLTPSQSAALETLCSKHPLLFSKDGYNLRLASVEPMEIELVEGARPVRIPPRPMNVRDREFSVMQIKDWALQGVIIPSSSKWQTGAQVAYNGAKPRLVLNYIGLNQVTVFKPHPLPLLEEIRRRIGTTTTVFSKLDLKSSFILLPLHKDSQDYTTFVDSEGARWKFTRVPFGLMCSPTHFQEVMETVLANVPNCHIYLDDILVYSDTVAQHMVTLSLILERLDSAGLLLNSEKCHFLMSSVGYLGNVISSDGHRPDPERVRAVSSLPFPPTTLDLKCFFGLAEMLKTFIHDYGRIKGILLQLLQKDTAYLPSPVQFAAFQQLKLLIASSVLLYNPDMSRTFYLRTDFSDLGLGAVLYQLDNDKHIRVVQFLSRALHGAEKNYPPQKGEFLAIKWATTVLQHWLVGHKDVVIITDHESLQYCMADTQKEASIRRWAASLRLIQPRFIYRKGSSNAMADFLSRHTLLAEAYGPVLVDDESGGAPGPSSSTHPSATVSVLADSSPPAIALATVPPAATRPSWLDVNKLVALQRNDRDCKEILSSPRAANRLAQVHRVTRFLVDPVSNVLLAQSKSGASYKTMIVIPRSITTEVIAHMHNKAHFRLSKTTKAVANEFYWHSLRADVEAFLKDCVPCAERDSAPKVVSPKGQLRAFRPNQLVSSDVMGPLPLTAAGNSLVVTFTCIFTRFTVAVAIADQTAATISRAFVEHWVAYFGPPEHLLTDNGSNYKSTLFAEVCALLLVHRIYTTPYHPQGDAVSERFNRTLQRAIAKLSSDASRWDLHLPLACAAYNAAVTASTQVSPFLAMMGREPPPLISLPLASDQLHSLSDFAAAAKRAQLVVATQINKSFDVRATAVSSHNMAAPAPFKAGDVVLLHDPVIPSGPGGKKFFRPFQRRFRVHSVRLPNTVMLVPLAGPHDAVPRPAHFDRIKLAPPSLQTPAHLAKVPSPVEAHPAVPAQLSPATAEATVLLAPPSAAPRASASGRTIRTPRRFVDDA